MNIAIIGTGYVGLVSGICFAETGNNVICIDNNQQKVSQLLEGKLPIYEPGLDVLFERNRKENRLQFTTSLEEGCRHAQIIFLALPTPPGEDGAADLRYVLGVSEQLSKLITEYKVIVNKSTVPVGTAEKTTEVIAKNLDKSLFDVVSNPEFLREGVAVEDFLKPDRVVIGTESERARKLMNELYQPFVRQGNPIYFMDTRSSEMTKYAANSYLAMRISFMNEMANLCDLTGANVDMVRIGMGSDSRIGKRFLFPGIGYGGSCFPKDVQALDYTADDFGYNYKLIKSVIEVNDNQRKILGQKILNHYKGNISGKTFAMWGLSFKPETDDIREAPSIYLIDELLAQGAKIRAFDPEAMDNIKAIYNNKIYFAQNSQEALEGADALVIVTEWSVFRNPDFNKLKELLKEPVIFDGRNVFSLEKMKESGFHYISMGRPTIK